MTSFDSHESQEARSVIEDCAQFVLAQIDHSRRMHMFFARRFENLVTYYMAALGAVLSAIVIIVTSLQSFAAQRMSLALLGIGVWGFSIVTFTRLSITRAMMVVKNAEVRRFEEYFRERYPDLRRYCWRQPYGPTTTGVGAYWQSHGFSRQTLALFSVLAVFIGVVASATSILTIGIVFDPLGVLPWQQSVFVLRWYLIGGIGAFGGSLLLTLLILRWQLKQATKWAESQLVGISG